MPTHRTCASQPPLFRARVMPLLVTAMLAACGEGAVTRTAEVSAITISPPNASMVVGGTLALAAQVEADAATSPELFWSSSDATVAAVTSSGVVRALKAGRANIAATALGNSAVSSIVVSAPPVTPPPVVPPTVPPTVPPVIPPAQPQSVASVSVSVASGAIDEGKTTQATAVLRATNGSVLTGRAVSWSTSSPSLATISATGLVTARKKGMVTISATSEGKQGSTTLTIRDD